ncbi:MAG: pyruvate dehydrogenase (acetyl-transferring), homodimeric type [Acidobacteriota bacterium]
MADETEPTSNDRRHDVDPIETREWLESLDSVLEVEGAERAAFLLDRLLERARRRDVAPRFDGRTPYVNTLDSADEPEYPGDLEREHEILALLRWNAMATVVQANKELDGIGGHIATYQSVAQLFEVGFHHFWRAYGSEQAPGGDLVFFQGHASPGIYARALLEGQLDEEQVRRFRQEVDGRGISSYPHPWLMPDFWQFATVSMGLGPLLAIYQARFLKYLQARGLVDAPRDEAERHVWVFCGDGEMDEPESLGALTVAARERLDNLVLIVNCNLQRLDGPVRGNGKIVQELEGVFHGAGWRVLKVLWGGAWDSLLDRDHDGALQTRLLEIVDGQWQAATVRGGAYLRELLVGSGDAKSEAIASLLEPLSDEELADLPRGGHDPRKVYAAYRAAVDATDGRPTAILAQTVKGFGMGEEGEGLNTTHQTKKLSPNAIRAFARRFDVPVDDDVADHTLPLLRLDDDSPAKRYLDERRAALGGPFPARRRAAEALDVPDFDHFAKLTEATKAGREISTTMAFVQWLRTLYRHKPVQDRLVPILADEARTFGMEGLFRQMGGIYSPLGQLYEPVDSGQLAPYTEARDGQILQEGINEAGALASWTAAGMSYSTHDLHMVPFYIYYSMFGFQRVGDFIWAAADMQARGFLLGATSGRTTLNGEGLQHEDGHSQLIAATVPTCRSYDPTFHYEVAVILHDGMRRMFGEADENVFYYLTLTNESYPHHAMPEGAAEGIVRGMHRLPEEAVWEGEEKTPVKGRKRRPRVRLLGCGSILREVMAAARLLHDDWQIDAEVWSVTSFNELRRDGLAVERWNRLHPGEDARTAYVAEALGDGEGPVIASTDSMESFADQIRPWVPARYVTLGTDGFGRSDSREALRRFFEIDRHYVVLAALNALATDGTIDAARAAEAIERYEIAADAPNPSTV